MPAPDLFSLYAFEDALEPAAVTGLTAYGVPACRQRDGSVLGTPRVEVALWSGLPTGKQHAPAGALFAPGQTFPCAFHAKLVTTVVTNRKGGPTNAGRHAEFLGKCRVMMLLATGSFNNLLSFHRINLVKDGGVHPSAERDADLDVSPLVWEVQFEVRADAWPVAEA